MPAALLSSSVKMCTANGSATAWENPTTRRFGSSFFPSTLATLKFLERNPATMSYPNPQEAPNEFLDHLKSLNLIIAVNAFLHNQNRPIRETNGRLNEGTAQEWCERIDTHLVSTIQSDN